MRECVSKELLRIFSKMASPIKITHRDEEGLVVIDCVPSKKPRVLEIISNVSIK